MTSCAIRAFSFAFAAPAVSVPPDAFAAPSLFSSISLRRACTASPAPTPPLAAALLSPMRFIMAFCAFVTFAGVERVFTAAITASLIHLPSAHITGSPP